MIVWRCMDLAKRMGSMRCCWRRVQKRRERSSFGKGVAGESVGGAGRGSDGARTERDAGNIAGAGALAAAPLHPAVGIDKLVANAQLLARAAREAVTAIGLELFAAEFPGAPLMAVKAPAGMDLWAIATDLGTGWGRLSRTGGSR